MKASMTSRERLLAAIHREEVDHIPFAPHMVNGPAFKAPLFWHDQFDKATALLNLGLDPYIEIWMPDVAVRPDVEVKTWREEKDGDYYLTKEYHTPAGLLRQVVRETADWCDWKHAYWIPTTFGIEKRTGYEMALFDDHNVSRRTEPWLKEPDDIEKLKYVLQLPSGYLLDEWRMDTERAIAFAREHDLLTVYRRTIVGDAYQWFCDIPWFMIQTIENPAFVHDFFGVFQEWSLQLIDIALETDVDVVQYRGWYETPPFWGPESFREFLFPIIQEEGERVHSGGKLFSYLLPEGYGLFADVLKDSNIDVFQGVDPGKLHGGTLKELGAKLGGKGAFWGGVSGEQVINTADPALIEQAVVDAIDGLGSDGGLILSAFIDIRHPQEGIMRMIEAWKAHR